jgi:SAM-dependent methyltransferase
MPSSPDLDRLKEKMKATWMAGDFGKIAAFTATEAESFVAALGILKGSQVLDVACGTGNLAIPAARRGAVVTGIDIAPNLLRQARHRANAEGVDVNFEEGDAEDLPFRDGEFDGVMSMFGAMFAPRPDVVASELARVCRRGGKIAMANWTPEGFTGKLFRLSNQYVPPPEGIAPPVLWGDEGTVRKRFESVGVTVETRRRKMVVEFPFSPAETVRFFRDNFGPTKVAFERLDEARQAAYQKEMEALWAEHNQASGDKTVHENEYLTVIGLRN